MFTWQPSLHTATYQLRTGRQAPGMAFKRDSLKALCKVQILGKFRDSILDMTMHLYKINEMHWSQLPHFLQESLQSETEVFPPNWCVLVATAWSTELFPSQICTLQRGEDSEPPPSQLNELAGAGMAARTGGAVLHFSFSSPADHPFLSSLPYWVGVSPASSAEAEPQPRKAKWAVKGKMYKGCHLATI